MADGIKFVNRIARINLSTGEVKKEEMNEKDARDFVGGMGTALKLLYDEVRPEVDPLSPDNKLIYTAGPLNGTRIPGSGIVNVSGKSPLTGYLISAQANGFFGARMRFAGFETIIVEGRAPDWSYIWIDDGNIEIRDARHLYGKGTWETEAAIKEELERPHASVGCIGMAGEQMVKFACTMFDSGHAASTNGSGCVMGSKNLKAVVVSAAHNVVDVYDPEVNLSVRKRFFADADATSFGQVTRHAGTHGFWPYLYRGENIAIKNYSSSVWPTIEKYYWDNRDRQYDRKKAPCWACPWAHCGTVKVKSGKAAGYEGEEPEYETMVGFTLNIGNDDIGEGVRLLTVNEDYGYDMKELTYTISLCMECYEKGILTSEDTGGLDLSWGNLETVERLFHMIAFREGFGAKLAEGVKKTAENIGGEALDIAVYFGRGNAPHIVDGRSSASILHSFALADNGSIYGGGGKNPQLGIDDDPGNDTQKVLKNFANGARKRIIEDSVGLCDFYQHGDMKLLCEAVEASTGWEGFDLDELLKAGQRGMNVARAYNVRNGLTPEIEGSPSPRAVTSPVDSRTPGKTYFDKELLLVYYRACGWDEKTCKALPSTLRELGLEYMIEDLWPEGENSCR